MRIILLKFKKVNQNKVIPVFATIEVKEITLLMVELTFIWLALKFKVQHA